MTKDERDEMVERAESLLDAVRSARAEANKEESFPNEIGTRLLSYITDGS